MKAQTKPEAFDDIANITFETRKERLIDDFDLDPKEVDNESWPHDDPLLGWCHINAELLARRLTQAGYNAEIIWGALIEPLAETPPSTQQQADTNGTTHFWVEVEVADSRIICDLAQEFDGWPLISQSLPDNYHRLPNCRIPYQKKITTKQLRNMEGYRHLKSENMAKPHPLNSTTEEKLCQ